MKLQDAKALRMGTAVVVEMGRYGNVYGVYVGLADKGYGKVDDRVLVSFGGPRPRMFRPARVQVVA